MESALPYFTTQWDFYAEKTDNKLGWVTELGPKGCTLSTNERIDHRRWLRMLIHFEESQVHVVAVGLVVKGEQRLEANRGPEVTLYNYQIEFNYDLDLILALSKRNLMVFSCRQRKIKSSIRPGFLA